MNHGKLILTYQGKYGVKKIQEVKSKHNEVDYSEKLEVGESKKIKSKKGMMKIIIMTEHIEAKIMSRILMKRRLSKDRLRQNETLGNEKSMV